MLLIIPKWLIALTGTAAVLMPATEQLDTISQHDVVTDVCPADAAIAANVDPVTKPGAGFAENTQKAEIDIITHAPQHVAVERLPSVNTKLTREQRDSLTDRRQGALFTHQRPGDFEADQMRQGAGQPKSARKGFGNLSRS